MATNTLNVGFKKGSSEKLKALTSYTPGTFYLTEDTDKLYFANESNELKLLNSGIRIYQNINELPTTVSGAKEKVSVGDFGYIIDTGASAVNTHGGNILVVCTAISGDSITWTQVNPDNNNILSVINIANTSVEDKKATITTSIVDNKNVKVEKAYTLIAGDNVHLGTDAEGNLKISADNDATHYTLSAGTESSEQGNISLTPTAGDSTSVKITGDTGITVSTETDGVKITGTDYKNTGAAIVADDTGAIKVSVSDVSGTQVSDGLTLDIKYGAEETKSSAKFINGVASLNIYTKDEIDDKFTDELARFDAMEYAGTVSSEDFEEKLVGSVKIGTVYKASDIFSFNGVYVKTGDLVIAGKGSGDEGSETGVIWDVVPSGDDQTITGNTTSSAVSVSDGSGVIAGFSLTADTSPISVEGVVNGKTTSFTVKHDTIEKKTSTVEDGLTQLENQDLTFTTVTGITRDDYGHITNVETTEVTVKDTWNTITDVSMTTEDITNGVKLSTGITTKEGTPIGNVNITGSGIDVTQADNAINIALNWGEF